MVNEDDNTIVQFVIGTDGKLYPYNTVNTPGIFPLAIAASKSNLFVVDTLPAASHLLHAEPCSGSIAVFPLDCRQRRHARQPSERRPPIPPSMGSTGR